jgi:hypothetical protein
MTDLTGLRQLSVCTDYGELHEALRQRVAELGINYQTLMALSGLTYADKLLAPMPLNNAPPPRNGRRHERAVGPKSLGPLLWGLGVVLIVAEDPVLTARHRRRPDFAKRAEHNVTAKALSINDMIQQRALGLLARHGIELERNG